MRKLTDCLIGFDGYIDELYTVVSNRKGSKDYTRMEWMEEFGRKVIMAAHRSADIEIVPLKLSFGGNAPILSNALAHLGYRTACIGNMDNVQGEDPFNQMHPLCEKISIGQTNRTIALEFTDGKIMLGNLYGNCIGWEEIKQKVGILRFRELVQESRLIGMVNWSGMLCMNDVISGFYEEFLLPLEKEQKADKDIFMDLADPSARSEEDLHELYDLIRLMASTVRLSLGMNENEVKKIGESMGMEEDDIVKYAEAIRSELGVYQVVVHTHDFIVGCRMGQWERIENQHIAVPVQSTGAGDHFNAGFCMGILEGKSLIECMRLGQAMGHQYVSTGITADREQLLREF